MRASGTLWKTELWILIINASNYKHIYGPVPSKRLGKSLGIDLVPFKIYTYNCIYCQLGRTTRKTLERWEYVPIDEVLIELERKLASGIEPDYISLAGSGEPTLNSGIGKLISKIKSSTNIPVAVLTNGSLLWKDEVRESLMDADLVLPSLDAGDSRLFSYVNRPHKDISFNKMVEGIVAFTRLFSGKVWLEVFLLNGMNGIPAEVEKIAALVGQIQPERVQLNTVTRPPAEDFAFPLTIAQLNELKGLFSCNTEVIGQFDQVESNSQLDNYSGNEAILALLGRHPCTVEGVSKGLSLSPVETSKRLQELCQLRLLKAVHRDNGLFYEIIRDKRGIQCY